MLRQTHYTTAHLICPNIAKRLSHPRMARLCSSLQHPAAAEVCLCAGLLTLANSLPPRPSFARRFGRVGVVPAWTPAAAGCVLPLPLLPPSERSADDTTASALAVVVQWLPPCRAHTPAAPPPSARGRTEKMTLLPGIATRTDRGLMVASVMILDFLGGHTEWQECVGPEVKDLDHFLKGRRGSRGDTACSSNPRKTMFCVSVLQPY